MNLLVSSCLWRVCFLQLWSKYVLSQASHPHFRMCSTRSTFMFALFAVLLAVGAAAPAADSAAPEDYSGSADYSDLNDYWQGPDGAVWQDLQLLFSFLTGILFVRSAETIFDARGASGGNLRKLELYPLLAWVWGAGASWSIERGAERGVETSCNEKRPEGALMLALMSFWSQHIKRKEAETVRQHRFSQVFEALPLWTNHLTDDQILGWHPHPQNTRKVSKDWSRVERLHEDSASGVCKVGLLF